MRREKPKEAIIAGLARDSLHSSRATIQRESRGISRRDYLFAVVGTGVCTVAGLPGLPLEAFVAAA
ncbi:MAG: hypothetical protein M3R31_01695, partial [Pseudomonadota bacterium]|nr:hypothetical protein [Pseudomonadota bacterium]